MIPGAQGNLQGLGGLSAHHGGGMGAESSSGGAAGGGGGGKYTCPNCSKSFARDDLLRRHLAREARAMAQPQVDRQKSCHECARSKARCDLEVPSCGRCRSRGKQCQYGARSGNPNVRRHRESAAPATNMAGMDLSGASSYGGVWRGGESAYHGSEGPTDGRPSHIISTDDSSSEGSFGWSDPNPVQHASSSSNTSSNSYLPPHRTYSGASVSSSHSQGAVPSSLPQQHHPQQQQQQQQQQHYLGPNTMPSGPYQMDSAITPTTYLTRHAIEQSYTSGQQPVRSQSGMLMTELDRTGVPYKAEEGEETPVGRYVGSFAGGATQMDPRGNYGRLVASPGGMTPGGHPDMWNSVSAPGPSGQQQFNLQAGDRMGPPSLPFGASRSVPNLLSPNRESDRQRPQPHKLLTGVNMPQPSRLDAPGAHMLSGRPLFSAIMDLSGWLEEPVVPSPLYPSGTSLSSLGLSSGISGLNTAFEGAADQTSMSVEDSMAGSGKTQSQQRLIEQGHSTFTPSMPASRYWWANPPSQMDVSLMQSVAQATATHLSHYPHLMVLPDPSSPVPPTVHRPWMAHVRGNLPSSLAIARVVLAGYAVRLPASEHVVWESVARETRRLIQNHESICTHSNNLEVLGATEALFLYSILLLMCTDPGASSFVDMSLTNTAFFALSQLAKNLSVRLQIAQQERARRDSLSQQDSSMDASSQQGGGGGDKQQLRENWLSWGFEETMRRTLWASYAILVLQRFRDGAVLSEGHLAGLDLIMDIQLPAVAAEFEAATEEEWKEARKQTKETLLGGGSNSKDEPSGEMMSKERSPLFSDLTFRDLIRYRPTASSSSASRKDSTGGYSSNEVGGISGGDSTSTSTNTPGLQHSSASSTTTPSATHTASTSTPHEAPRALLAYFERHDAFVATVLSIAFCLDSGLSV